MLCNCSRFRVRYLEDRHYQQKVRKQTMNKHTSVKDALKEKILLAFSKLHLDLCLNVFTTHYFTL